MKFIKQTYLFEISFLLIAVSALILAAINTAVMVMSLSQMEAAQGGGTLTSLTSRFLSDETPSAEVAVSDSNEETPVEPTLEGEDDVAEQEEDETFVDEEADEFYLVDAAAQILGLKLWQLEEAVLRGKSVSEIADEQGVDVSDLSQQLVAQEQAYISRLAQAGEIDAEEAEWWQAEVAVMTPYIIEQGYLEPEIIALQRVGLQPEMFYAAWESGETIANLARQQGVEPQSIVEAIISNEDGLIEHLLTNEFIDSDEAAEWQAETRQFADEFVNQPIEAMDEE